MMTDETAGGQLAASSASSAGAAPKRRTRSTPRYTDAALPRHQWRITDLIPARPVSQAVVATFGAAVVGLCLCLEHWAGEPWADLVALSGRGTLSGWLVSVSLAGAAVWCLLVFALRRHKIDDYNGRYRVWLWASAGCLAASAAAAIPLGTAVRQAMVATTGWVGPGDGLWWWIAPVGAIGAILIARLAWDMRECRTACAAMLLAGSLAAGRIVLANGWVEVTPANADMLHGLLTLSATLLFCWSLSFYGRHVLLDAQGLLAPRNARASKTRKPPSSRSNDLSPPRPTTPEAPEPTPVDEPQPPSHRMSKSERRRLRKQRRPSEPVGS